MGWASRAGRAKTNSGAPRAHAICDGCGFRFNHYMLRPQYEWRGTQLMNTSLLKCSRCIDVPQEQLRTIILPPDPVPIDDPRPEYFQQYETTSFYTSGQDTTDPLTGLPVIGGDELVTENNDPYAPQQTGGAPGSLNEEPGTDPNAPGNDDPGLPYLNDEVPKTGPLS